MNILFICKYNRFRSKVAEALFNKFNSNKENKAKSAGIIEGNPVDQNILEAAKDFDLNLKIKPHGLTSKLLTWQNLAVIVADDVPEDILKENEKYGKKLIVWKISDTDSKEKEDIKKIILEIEIKVRKLIKELGSDPLLSKP